VAGEPGHGHESTVQRDPAPCGILPDRKRQGVHSGIRRDRSLERKTLRVIVHCIINININMNNLDRGNG